MSSSGPLCGVRNNLNLMTVATFTQKKKLYHAVVAFFVVINSGISTALPSNDVPAIMHEFNVTGDGLKVLPISVFVVGNIVGSMVFSTMSEKIGRKPVLLGAMTLFVAATLACAFAPDWAFFLVFRSICGLAAAAPQTVVGGMYADMFFDERTRGRAMVTYMSVSHPSLFLSLSLSLFGSGFQLIRFPTDLR